MTTLLLEGAHYVGSERAPLGSTAVSAPQFLPLEVPAVPSKRRKPTGVVLREQRPLDISLTQTQDGQWVADERITFQFGVGATANAAVADLIGTLKNYRGVLRARRYQLAPYLREHLRWLESAFD